jgi:hypothetical protein
MMNGIKEDIKTLLTLELGSPLFHEVLVNLAVRLKALQVHALLVVTLNCIWLVASCLELYCSVLCIACEILQVCV